MKPSAETMRELRDFNEGTRRRALMRQPWYVRLWRWFLA